MRAWLFQDSRQKTKLGDKAPWSVGWIDPAGKRKSKSIGSRSRAEKEQRKIEGQLAAGTYEDVSKKRWSEFREDYEAKSLAGKSAGSRAISKCVFNHFERIAKPVRVRGINSVMMADYIAKRRVEPKRKAKVEAADKSDAKSKADVPRVSVATVNKELRTLKAAFRKAVRWGYLPKSPEIDFLREPGKLPTYVTPEQFQAIYQNCDAARWPDDLPFTAADWWRGLLVTGYMTGWRIGSLLALRREDVDLEGGFALSRAADNKGKRDQKVPLHPLVVDHLRKLPSFSAMMFPWNHDRRGLDGQFHAIQVAAGVQPEGGKNRYGFHDLRRAFATMNAGQMTADALQALMQHTSYTTTQRYVNLARQLNPAVQNLFVPTLTAAKA